MHTGLQPADWVFLAIVIFSTLAAMTRGMIRELFSLAGLAAGILLASLFYDRLAAPLSHIISNHGMAEAVAFMLIVLAAMILAGLIGKVLRRTAQFVGLGWADSLAGAVFGLLRGVLLVTACMMAVAAFLPQTLWATQSKLAPYFLSGAHVVSSVVPTDLQQRVGNGIRIMEERTQNWMSPAHSSPSPEHRTSAQQ